MTSRLTIFAKQMERLQFTGTALVTGGSSGIGLEFARQLAGRGCNLALVSNRADELDAAKKALEAEYGVSVNILEADLARAGAAENVASWCDAEGLAPDILINDAGMFFMKYLSPEMLPKVRTMMNLHMDAATELCILMGERMKERGRGWILNVSSMTARIPAPGIAIYSATKAYLKVFGKSLSYEMRPCGVKVTTLCPAAVDTGLYPLSDGMRRAGRRLGLIWTPEKLVRRALRALFAGRRVVSPGVVNHLVPAVIAILPARLIDRLGMRWINK